MKRQTVTWIVVAIIIVGIIIRRLYYYKNGNGNGNGNGYTMPTELAEKWEKMRIIYE
jgi:hypothetical protein